jgi:hypothetical protein
MPFHGIDLDPGGPDESALEPVSDLECRRHGVVRLPLCGRKHGNGFMHFRVEGLPHRVEPLETAGFEFLPQLPVDQKDGLLDDVPALTGRTGHHAIEVVEDVQETRHQRRL